jgi:hypothetical protein
VDIAYCVLRKEQVYLHLRSNHQIVCNYLTGSLISHIVQRFHDGSRVEITVDKSLNGIQREAFDQYLVYKTFEKNQPLYRIRSAGKWFFTGPFYTTYPNRTTVF